MLLLSLLFSGNCINWALLLLQHWCGTSRSFQLKLLYQYPIFQKPFTLDYVFNLQVFDANGLKAPLISPSVSYGTSLAGECRENPLSSTQLGSLEDTSFNSQEICTVNESGDNPLLQLNCDESMSDASCCSAVAEKSLEFPLSPDLRSSPRKRTMASPSSSCSSPSISPKKRKTEVTQGFLKN